MERDMANAVKIEMQLLGNRDRCLEQAQGYNYMPTATSVCISGVTMEWGAGGDRPG